MHKRFVLAALILVVGAAAALAGPLSGKVAVISKQHVCVVVDGKPEAWMKKGAKVRVLGGKAVIVNAAPDTICVTTPNATKAKVGASITLEKPRPNAAGC